MRPNPGEHGELAAGVRRIAGAEHAVTRKSHGYVQRRRPISRPWWTQIRRPDITLSFIRPAMTGMGGIMHALKTLHLVGISALCLGGIAVGSALHLPAMAAQVYQQYLSPDTTCTSSSPCTTTTNNGNGPASANTSLGGTALTGTTKFNSTSKAKSAVGVLGSDLSTKGKYDIGVEGTSVSGTGAQGTTKSGTGVSGLATTGTGVSGVSTSGVGMSGSSSGTGVFGSGTSIGVQGN